MRIALIVVLLCALAIPAAALADGAPVTMPATLRLPENAGNFSIPLSRPPGAGAGAVGFMTVPGTAGGSDFSLVLMGVSFSAGQTEALTPPGLGIVDDAIDEPDETFSVYLRDPSGDVSIGTPRTEVTIVDNDEPIPQLVPKVTTRWRRRGTATVVETLVVRGLPTEASLAVSCSGDGCPFLHWSPRVRAGTAALTRGFRRARLRPGTFITLDMTRPGWIGRRVSFAVRANRTPLKVAVPIAAATRSRATRSVTGVAPAHMTVIAIAPNGDAVSGRGHFHLVVPASVVTLHLRDRHGRYAGPVVVAGTATHATLGVRAGADVGRIRAHSGYGTLSTPLEPRAVAAGAWATAAKGVPVGAGRLGLVTLSTPITRGGPGADADHDGLPGMLDVDDDGDGRVDLTDFAPGDGTPRDPLTPRVTLRSGIEDGYAHASTAGIALNAYARAGYTSDADFERLRTDVLARSAGVTSGRRVVLDADHLRTATPDQLLRVPGGRHDRWYTLGPALANVPALHGVSANFVSGLITYPWPAANPGTIAHPYDVYSAPDGTHPIGLLAWRPQRPAIPSAAEPFAWMEMGSLTYGVYARELTAEHTEHRCVGSFTDAALDGAAVTPSRFVNVYIDDLDACVPGIGSRTPVQLFVRATDRFGDVYDGAGFTFRAAARR